MKTAISLPDDLFDRASRRATALGVSRSQFFSDAARRYLDELDAGSVTEQINTALGQSTELDDSSADAAAAGQGYLAEIDDEW